MTDKQLATFYLGMVTLAARADVTELTDINWHLRNANDHVATVCDPKGLFDRDATKCAIESFISAVVR